MAVDVLTKNKSADDIIYEIKRKSINAEIKVGF